MSDDDMACERHDLEEYPTGYDHCPYCRMESDREAQLMERATRHAPRMVDDPAPTSSYDAW